MSRDEYAPNDPVCLVYNDSQKTYLRMLGITTTTKSANTSARAEVVRMPSTTVEVS